MTAMPPRPPIMSIDDVGETTTYTERATRGGARMFYEMNVLQQPERARACGSGSKSAADRRPVDPPPVVQLKVLRGPTREEAEDITMSYTANFFLFAELCPARAMAHGRVQTPVAQNGVPVLTGMPVSGMAYLDRPSEAGYFLFPDLSVRHEGRYVLAFHLYEDIKKPEDRDPGGDDEDEEMNPCFDYRMAVKSVPFSVYSAKKFPGLTESTHLSKTISEQGCRVRIRRDVRMRRREGKPSGNDYESNNDNEFRRSRRTQTPEIRSNAEQYRARSSSNSSEHRAAYPPPAPERRSSAVEGFQPPPPPLPYGPGPASSNVHLRFGSDASSAPYPPQHAPPIAQPPPVSPTSSYHSSQPSPYQPAPPSYGSYSRPSSQYAPSNPPPTPHHDAYERRQSAMAMPPSPSVYGPRAQEMPRRESDLRRDSLQHHQPLPPLDSGVGRVGRQILPSIDAMTAPPTHMTNRGEFIEPGPIMPPAPQESARAGSKRGYSDTFAENNRPLYDRQRPQDVHHSSIYNPRSHNSDPLSYKRADGTLGTKPSNDFFRQL